MHGHSAEKGKKIQDMYVFCVYIWIYLAFGCREACLKILWFFWSLECTPGKGGECWKRKEKPKCILLWQKGVFLNGNNATHCNKL